MFCQFFFHLPQPILLVIERKLSLSKQLSMTLFCVSVGTLKALTGVNCAARVGSAGVLVLVEMPVSVVVCALHRRKLNDRSNELNKL